MLKILILWMVILNISFGVHKIANVLKLAVMRSFLSKTGMTVLMILNKGSVTVKMLSRPVVKVRLMEKKLRNRLKKQEICRVLWQTGQLPMVCHIQHCWSCLPC